MPAYYNEVDPFAAQWLRNLIAARLIPAGDVDERSIEEVQPDDLAGYTQCHWFAGIGGWALAARLAGIRDDEPLWTGSCPCQPYSVAGRGRADDDPRNLWPHLRRLIAECRPAVVAGEQVASAAGRTWLSGVRLDLEALGYGVGAADLCAAGVGAPHIRQRLWWLADADADGLERQSERDGAAERDREAGECRDDPDGRSMVHGGMGDAQRQGLERHPGHEHDWDEPGRDSADADRPVAPAGGDSWSGAIWIPCADGKARRIEPGLEPLVDGLRESLVRCYDLEASAFQEIEHAQIDPDPDQALRILWRFLRAALHQRQAGGSWRVPAPEILLPFLLSVRAARFPASYGGSKPETSQETHWRALRFMRNQGRFVRAPRQRESDGQQSWEHSDVMRALSLVLARTAESYSFAAEQAYAATDRVGRVRAYGNAIVPQLAAEFLMAYRETA